MCQCDCRTGHRAVQFQRPLLQFRHQPPRPFVRLVEVHVVEWNSNAQRPDDLYSFVIGTIDFICCIDFARPIGFFSGLQWRPELRRAIDRLHFRQPMVWFSIGVLHHFKTGFVRCRQL